MHALDREAAWSSIFVMLCYVRTSASLFTQMCEQHLHTRGAETDNRGTAQYGGMTSGAKPSTGALKQRRRPQQQRAQPGQAADGGHWAGTARGG